MSKKQSSQDRKARVAEMQRAERERERKVRVRIIAACAVVLVLLGGVITYAVIDAQNNQPEQAISAIGVAASAASCDAVTDDAASGNQDHVGPNTNTPNTLKVDYATVPPSTGAHFISPVVSDSKFYAATDRPPMENLVHNLEHGYTILWYDEKAGDAVKSQLEELAKLANDTSWARDKFIVTAWDTSYGAFPTGKDFAVSHWSATVGDDGTVTKQSGHRQLCGKLSGEAVRSFIQTYPSTDAPEPNGA